MPHDLSERECEILALVADGNSNDQAAAALGISPNTVAAHMRSIFAKLEVTDRTAAFAVALRRGLVRLD